jgi:hypothetical protein
MASRCFTPFKVAAVRVTLLDSCGQPSDAECSAVSSTGIITIEQTANYEERQEFFVKNADGKFCVQRTDPPILKWLDMTYTFCDVDPELVNFLTGQGLIMSDADEPVAIGNSWRTNDSFTVNYAFEGWTRVAAQPDCDDGELYGYVIFPWNVEGTMSDVTYENGAANFVVTARTQVGSGWGVGPYNVIASEAAATLGDPLPLLTAIEDDEHRRMFTTFLAPPSGQCGCYDATPAALTFTDSGVLEGTVTLPLAADFPNVFPGTIDWGDMSTTAVTTGPTSVHTYAGAGSYVVTFTPDGYSSPIWASASTPIA